jgi:U3 small nucleolar RNA-associated protein 21
MWGAFPALFLLWNRCRGPCDTVPSFWRKQGSLLAISAVQQRVGEPVLMSSAADNSLKQHIFDNEDGSGRLLRFRSGHAAPPQRLMFYGPEGRVLLSAAADHAVRVFSVIQDQQSREMSQVSSLATYLRSLSC